MNKRIILLIACAALLVVVKFLLVPVYSAQNERAAELQVLQKRLSKVQALKNAETDLMTNLQQATELEAAQASQLWTSPHLEQLNVVMQEQLQNWFAQHGVTVQIFNWVGTQQTASSQLIVGRAAIRLNGKVANLATALTNLPQHNAYIRLVELESSVSQISADAVEMQLTLDALLRLQEAQE